MIYLRANEKNVFTKYGEFVEKAGLMVIAKQAVALYTCKVAPPRGEKGETGDPGTDGASTAALDCIISSCSDEYSNLEVDAVNPAVTFRSPYELENAYILIDLTTAATGAEVIVDVHLNGVTMLSTLIHIDAGTTDSYVSATVPVYTITDVPFRGRFQVFITQVGSITTGTGLKCTVVGNKVVA